MKPFLIALQFLTVFPVRISSEITADDSAGALIFFPVVGALIGVILCLISLCFSFLPHLVTIAILLSAMVIVSGAIHLDGFVDTCDGIFSGRKKEEILEIMRDSRVGAMGAIGVTLLLLLKFTLLASIPKVDLWKLLILTPLFSRWAQVFACYSSPYAHKEGKARYFVEGAGKKEMFIATVFMLAAFVLLMPAKGITAVFFSIFAILLLMGFVKKKIGGMTGDTIGAVSELSEVCLLFFILVLSCLGMFKS
ncbi:adenosylcobinamide-GDP ribazoletransferase [bacterium]|nr:MAG: adenosylcobinamide-GDP ribazoletransferase [bacterium]